MQHSKGIEPPTEIAATIEDFPEFIQRHLINNDLPIYAEIMNNSLRIRPSKEDVLTRNIDVPVKRQLYKRLRDIGFLPRNMEFDESDSCDHEVFDILNGKGLLKQTLENKDLTLKDAYLKGGVTIGLTIQNIDPIFAYVSDPFIMNDSEFQRINHRYLPTLEKIKNSTPTIK